MPKTSQALSCTLLLLSGLFSSSAMSALVERIYTVGVVPQFEAKKLYKIWKPILEQLEKTTGVKLELEGASSIPAFEKAFLAGKYDFAYMNPFHLLIANESQGYYPLIRDHGKKLSGILTVRKDSPVRSVKELDSQVLAFPSPNALGASLQMRAELHDIYKINIKPVYVKTHDSVYLNVLLKQAAAGGGVQNTFNKQKKNIQSALRIIHRTQPVAPHPIAAHPRVEKKLARKIQQAILKLSTEEKGRKLLSRIPLKKAGKATLADYEPLKQMKLKRFFVAE